MNAIHHHARDPQDQLRPLRANGGVSDMINQHDEGQTIVETSVAGHANVEFIEVIQDNVTDVEDAPECQAEFALGISTGKSFGSMAVDAGEGVHNFPIERDGAYLNHPYGQKVSIDGRARIVILALPYSDLAARLEMDATVLENALRPLHERLISEAELIRPLAFSMWQASRGSDQNADLFVDQAMDTLALHTLSLSRGGAWGTRAFLDGDRASLEDRITQQAAPIPKVRIKRVIEYIEENLGLALRVSDLAGVAGMSNSYFSRCFKATVGEPAWSYVRRRRIEMARDLLRNASISIAEIAYKTGFSSQAHLTAAFSEHFGIPPAKYRSEIVGIPERKDEIH